MSSTSDDDSENFNTGAALMIVGIAIQVGDCSGFLRSIGLAISRYLHDKPLGKGNDTKKGRETPKDSPTTLAMPTKAVMVTRRQIFILTLGLTTFRYGSTTTGPSQTNVCLTVPSIDSSSSVEDEKAHGVVIQCL
ncbi:hypothetical protein Moror_5511 [Moniliophthora roreri MCA 2997]|uniref:Uncharacterized protein n=2 Tax=Moniliophthora roreri TaxID=221103 RepID=V2WN03_MONRO|nr:hypothetical protein Moror_5511 [Moniliophthora roreri MCA 2997]